MRSVLSRRTAVPTALALCSLLAASGCGSGDSSSESGSGDMTFEGRGPITYVAGKDTTGTMQAQLDRWNKKHPDQKVTFIELPTDADAQRQQMIQNAETESDAYTVLSLDAVWTSEFAANRWIDQLPKDEFPLDTMLQPVVDTATYRGKLYAAPASSDGGLLYYRTDLLEQAGVAEPPATWDEMKKACAKVLKLPEAEGMTCYTGQFEKYEGLTVNFSEAVHSAGGVVTDANGKPNVDTPEARRGLDFLVDSFEDGTIAKKAITYQEEDGRRAFQKGDVVFMRQWPYAYALLNKKDGSSDVAGKFDVAPLPGADGPGTSSLGGHNLALASSAKNKATALDFMKFLSNEENTRKNLKAASLAPPYATLYEEQELIEKYPYLPELKESIVRAKPRPRVVRYGDVTRAIQEEAYAALNGRKSSAAALKSLQKSLEKLTTPGQ
ncbi:ABC transporter substrate-binding protein [Streptomyces sp. JJ36]|uniref:ABC transporter substrate-binding protein n=1 Tax=Streptomyces sp. JJ36 TaxID=2736645 RepID=UPI001F420B95|nr:ABC transporter substrate-binding protein [Streptomyces sp. JJ36]MCF6525884.1 ABC transporter substrate-binding protein [Streptomyces sp. JJ36]